MYKLVVSQKFDGAHRLYQYKGDCSRLHGHTWKVELCVEGKDLDSLGMVIDFRDLKKVLNEVVEQFDHMVVLNFNDPLVQSLSPSELRMLYGNPTAENLAKFIYDWVKASIGARIKIEWVRIWESETAYVEYRE